MRKIIGALVQGLILASAALAQPAITGPLDPMAFSQLKDFTAHRSSSNSPLAGLERRQQAPSAGRDADDRRPDGPGDRDAHLDDGLGHRVRLAASAAAARLLRRQRRSPSVDVPLGDFFAVGHGFERADPLAHDPQPAPTAARATATGRCRSRSRCRITLTNEGTRRLGALLPRGLGEGAEPAARTRRTSTRATARLLPAPADGTPWVFLDTKGRGFYVGTVLVDRAGRAGLVRRGRRHVLRRRREGRLDPGHRLRGLLQRRVGPPRRRGRVHRLADLGRGGARRAHDARTAGTSWIPCRSRSRSGSRSSTRAGPTSRTARVQDGVRRARRTSSPRSRTGTRRASRRTSRPCRTGRRACRRATRSRSRSRSPSPTRRREKGKVSVSKELFWGKDVILFEAEGPGARIEVPFDVDEDGDYELSTQVAQAPDYGIYEILLDGKPATAPRARARARRRHPDADAVRRLRLRHVRRPRPAARMAEPDEGPALADVRRALGKNPAVVRLHARRGQRHPRANGREGLVRGGDARPSRSSRPADVAGIRPRAVGS